jgi:hypothetical protein
MASSFLERNRIQSEERASEPASRWKRGLGPLAAVMVVGMGFLMVPATIVTSSLEAASGLPGVGEFIAKAADLPARGKGQSFSELMAALKAANEKGGKGAWSLFGRSASRGDSLGMVRGDDAAMQSAAKLTVKGGGTTIAGIMTPGESRKSGGGVMLTNDDVLGDTQASHYTGRGGSMKVYAGKGLLTGGRVAPAQREDSSKNPTKGVKSPDASRGRSAEGKEPKITKADFQILQSNRQAFATGVQTGGKGSALSSLADARTQGQMARAPGARAEFANTSSSAVYDHNKAGDNSGKDAPPAVRGIDGGSTPGAIMAEGEDYKAEAEKIVRQQKACSAADAEFRPLIDEQSRRITGLSALPPTPQNKMMMRATCLSLDDLMRRQYEACPLRHEEGAYVPQNCG